jgi:hypothetical protein
MASKKSLYFTKIVTALETEKNVSKWLADNEKGLSKGALETAIYVVLGKGGTVPKVARELLEEMRKKAPAGGRGKPAIKVGDISTRKVGKLGLSIPLKPYKDTWAGVGANVDVVFEKDQIVIRKHKGK